MEPAFVRPWSILSRFRTLLVTSRVLLDSEDAIVQTSLFRDLRNLVGGRGVQIGSNSGFRKKFIAGFFGWHGVLLVRPLVSLMRVSCT